MLRHKYFVMHSICFENPLFQNPAEKITGTHCECRNFGCDLHNEKECGGELMA